MIIRTTILIIFLIGFVDCSSDIKNELKNISVQNDTFNKNLNVEKNEMNPVKPTYSEIVLSENKLDTFTIPFPEKHMLPDLFKYYSPYWVEANTEKDNGKNYTYFDILRDDDNPVAYLIFNPDNELILEEIRIVDSTAIDEYGVRVGDSYEEILRKRKGKLNKLLNSNKQVFLYSRNSNIIYELSGDFDIFENKIKNNEELKLNDEELKECKVKIIIWKNNKKTQYNNVQKQ